MSKLFNVEVNTINYHLKESKNDDGSVTVKEYRYIEQFKIRKNKSFATYLKEKKNYNIDKMTEMYKNKISQMSIFESQLENKIIKHKEEIFLCNYMVLEEEDYKFLEDIIYGELIILYSNVAKSMPQWYPKGEAYTETKEKEIKIGRNELCFCDSGKKSKKCHGR